MSSSIVETIKKIAEAEVRRIHVIEFGVVTSVFPHSDDSDNDNYECNVKLKNRDIELRKVPVATQHIGLANTPHVGDMVLVAFVNGDINSPVLIGRLYNDDDRPPANKMEEVVYKPSYSESDSLRRIHLEFPGGIILTVTDKDITAKAGKTTLTMNKDGDLVIESEAKISVKAKGDATLESPQGKMSISAQNIELNGQQGVNIKAGTNANFESSGQLKIKGAIVNIN